MTRAERALTNAWRLRPDLPQAPARMIYVAMGQSDADAMRLWFDRSLAAQLDYESAWHYFRWGLRPRWHGSAEALLALGHQALATGRFDTDVPRKLFDCVSDVESDMDLPPGKHIYGRPDIWPALASMYEGYISAESKTYEQNWWRSAYSVVAFLSGKLDVARSQMEALNWSPDERSLTGWGRDLSLLPMEIAAKTSPVSAKVLLADAERESGRTDMALRFYREQRSATNLDQRSARFIEHRIAVLEFEEQLRAEKTVSFIPKSTNDLNWVFFRGEALSLANDELEIRSGPGGHFLYSRARVGPNFEIKGEFELVRTSNKEFQGGLIVGIPEFEQYDQWYGFRIKRNSFEGDVVSFAEGWTSRQRVKKVSLNSQRNSFRLVMGENKFIAWVNDELVFSSEKLPSKIRIPPKEIQVGIGAFNDMNETVIRYRNLQLRKLPPSEVQL